MNADSQFAGDPTSPTQFRMRRWLRKAAVATAGTIVLVLGSLIMLAVAIVTLFQARRFHAEVIAKALGRIALWLCGVRMVIHQDQPYPQRQTIFISNHTSTLDVFVLIALGLPNARFFMSGFLRKILPLGLIGYLIGIFWTAPYRFHDKRLKIFQRAERILRRTGESVFLTPEGSRITTGEIGHFNRGAFHLATNLGAPIVPIYLHIPKETDPGLGLVARKGTVDVFFLPSITTDHWKLEDLDQNREKVRDIYVAFHTKLNDGKGPSNADYSSAATR